MRLGELKLIIDEIIARDPESVDSKIYTQIESMPTLELKSAERLIVNTYLEFGKVTPENEDGL